MTKKSFQNCGSQATCICTWSAEVSRRVLLGCMYKENTLVYNCHNFQIICGFERIVKLHHYLILPLFSEQPAVFSAWTECRKGLRLKGENSLNL